MLIHVNPETPHYRQMEIVADALKRGGIIAYPTDTYYGIGCDIMNKKAIQKIYRIKKRSEQKPFSFICSSLKNISDYAKVSNYSYKTMKRLLPGPYTFILNGSRMVPKIMLTRRKTAGIRVPNHPICIELVERLGNPIINTSATGSDDTIFSNPSLLHDHFKNQLDIVIDGGIVPNQPSSVISLIDDQPDIIRRGAGDVSMFE
jgi:tRNA threonylcarbamoyl adenosine modification protein (Sua5/YciO/YrdC/YwlC family)